MMQDWEVSHKCAGDWRSAHQRGESSEQHSAELVPAQAGTGPGFGWGAEQQHPVTSRGTSAVQPTKEKEAKGDSGQQQALPKQVESLKDHLLPSSKAEQGTTAATTDRLPKAMGDSREGRHKVRQEPEGTRVKTGMDRSQLQVSHHSAWKPYCR